MTGFPRSTGERAVIVSCVNTIHLIDASPYLFRAWFSLPDMEAPEESDLAGAPVSACYGWLSFLNRYLREEEPTHVAACFDESLNTSFRNDLYPEYKAQREEPDEELIAQLDLCKQLAEAMGVRSFADDRYEADDLIGTLANRFTLEGHDAVVVTPDKDLAQLVSDQVQFYDFAKGVRLDMEGVSEKWGVDAVQIPDFLGLAGDSVDNIPGVKGVGAKTAAAILAEFEDLDALYSNLEAVADLEVRGARTLGAKLEAEREMAFLSRTLATIALDAPADADLKDLEWRGAEAATMDELLGRLGFEKIRERIPRWR